MMRRISGLTATAFAIILTTAAAAQVQTSKSVDHGEASKTTTVERGEVVHVGAHDLMIKMEDGTIRDFQNISENATATVDGKQLTLRDLKPGMKLSRTITTTTTPRVVTTTQTVKGKVFFVTPPNSVILTLEDGSNEKFTIPKEQKFNIDGAMVDAFHLKKGMMVSATKIVEVPETVVAQQRAVTGSAPPPPPKAPAAEEPILISAGPAAPEAASAELPKAGSELPLIGLLGAFSLALAGGLRFLRKRQA
jgi:LPXTG-motif cell wall-anchored protein